MKAIDGFKIWQVNDYDWIWGTNFAHALEEYLVMTDMTLSDVFDENDGEINSKSLELSEEDLDNNNFLDEDRKETGTFRDQLKISIYKGDDPGIFASTEY